MIPEKFFVEALCWHEAFRKLGYAADDIFVGYAVDAVDPRTGYRGPSVLVQLYRSPPNFLIVIPDARRVCEADFPARWAVAATWWNGATQAEVRPLWEASEAFRYGLMLVEGLSLKGLYPPGGARA